MTALDTRSDPEQAGELFISRRAAPDEPSEPLAALAARYLDDRRQFEQRQTTDQENGEFVDRQAELLSQMQDTPAVTLDDIIAKLAVIREEIWDRIGSNEDQAEPADRLVRSLADDLRRVLGATTAYRFEPRLWVESAIRAGMEPIAMVHLAPIADGPRNSRGHVIKSRRLIQKVADVNPAYEPPCPASDAEMAAVLDELQRRGRADYYTRPADPG